MPFFDDSGPRVEAETRPLGRAFALLRDQLERMVALNLLWVAQGLPLLIAWAFPMPEVLRIILSFYTALAIPPATATVLGVLRHVSRGEPINVDLIRDCFRALAGAGVVKLMPLLSLFFWLAMAASFAAEQGWFVVDVAARLLFLLLVPVAQYFGPLIAAHPERPIQWYFRESIRLFVRHPERTLWLALICVFALILGAISIAGIVLIVPILILLLQTEFFESLH